MTETGKRERTWWRDDCSCPVVDESGDGCVLSTDTTSQTHLCDHCEAHADAAPSPALTREALAAALHKVYCREGAPMHSAPDHSAGRILEAALSKTPPPSSTREETP